MELNTLTKYHWLWDETDTGDNNERFLNRLSGNGTLYADFDMQRLLKEQSNDCCKSPCSGTYAGIPLREIRRAMARLIGYATYDELIELLPKHGFVMLWPQISGRIKSVERKAQMQALYLKLWDDAKQKQNMSC